ncbi:MAG: amidohydrolase family protein [Sedimentisphaerales bacterium]|nr:amidohydrolase family protein [Sedimentisphaerales bacterium]
MIVDCHTHVCPVSIDLGQAEGFSCFAKRPDSSATGQHHLDATAPADKALVLGFVSRHLDAEIPNELLASHISAFPEKLIGFAGVDPTDKDVLDKVRQAREEWQFAGLVVSPACQNFHPCDSRAMKLYELAEELGLPVCFLQGERLPRRAIMEYAQPMLLDEVARTFEDLKIVVSHMGVPWIDQAMALLAKHPTVFTTVVGLADKPWQTYHTITLAHEYKVTGQLLFGSGFPNNTVKSAIEALYNLNKMSRDSVLPAVPRELLRGIIERDSLTLLGLDKSR